jgi:hypothetical protein
LKKSTLLNFNPDLEAQFVVARNYVMQPYFGAMYTTGRRRRELVILWRANQSAA